VTGGNMANAGGRAFKTPARLCFERSVADTSYPADTVGDGSNIRVLLFNAADCYLQTSGGDASSPAAPANLTVR
jgi:hypothetical protein